MKLRVILIVLLAMFLLTSCSDKGDPSDEQYWQPWATNSDGHQSWAWFARFDSRDDCMHAVKTLISQGTLRGPYDCVYNRDNLYMMVLMNTLFQATGLKCIVKMYHPHPVRYDLVLRENKESETENWRCVYNF